MTTKLAAALLLLSLGTPAFAHRLDEYLQATIISLENNRVDVFLRLVPGIAVAPTVLAGIDTNHDGVLSEAERHAYAGQVLRDLSLSIDGHRLAPRLLSVSVPDVEEMKAGLSEVQIEFTADIPAGSSHRKLNFENHHQPQIAAYLVNCLLPRDHNIHILAQNRNQTQSSYQLEYTQASSYAEASTHRSLLLPIALCVLTGLLLVRVGRKTLASRRGRTLANVYTLL